MEKTWVKIPEVLFFQEGPGVRNTQYTTEGVKLLNVANLVEGKVDLSTSDRYISESEAYGKYRHFLCDVGDFVVASSGIKVDYIDKKMGFIDESMLPLCMNTSTIRFKVLDENRLRIRYFMYYLKSRHFKQQLFREITGSAQLNYGPSHLKKMSIPLINIKKQDEIIACMDVIQSITEMCKQELKKYDELIKARFVEMFGDSKLNDKCWNSGIVSDYYDVKGGKRIPKGMGYADEVTSHPYLRATDMKNETILDDDIHYINEEVFEHIKRYIVKGGDIYLTNVGVNLGMAGVIPDKYNGANLTENAVKLMPKTKKIINGVFLAHYINSPGIQDYINARKMSVGVPKLAIFRIETLPLLIPPIELQNQFAAFVAEVDKSKLMFQKLHQKLNILQQKAGDI